MLTYHGHYITVVVEDLQDWYYEGRAEIAYLDKYHYVEFTLTVDAQPFRQAVKEKSFTYSKITNKEITLVNDGVKVLPTVTVTEDTTIKVGDTTFTINAGIYEHEQLPLNSGKNTWIVTTTGTITIIYREAKI